MCEKDVPKSTDEQNAIYQHQNKKNLPPPNDNMIPYHLNHPKQPIPLTPHNNNAHPHRPKYNRPPPNLRPPSTRRPSPNNLLSSPAPPLVYAVQASSGVRRERAVHGVYHGVVEQGGYREPFAGVGPAGEREVESVCFGFC